MKIIKVNDLRILRYVFFLMKTNMYVIAEKNKALIIDPHMNEDLKQRFKAKKIDELTVVLTHEHPDHTSGVNWLKENFNTILICQKKCAESIAIIKNNRPLLISFLLAKEDEINGTNEIEKVSKYFKPYKCKADITFVNRFEYIWAEHRLDFIHTPGHSRGSSCIVFDEKLVFSGDLLIHKTPVITRFPGGSQEDYDNISKPIIKTFNGELFILPGHGDYYQLKDARSLSENRNIDQNREILTK